MYIGIIDSVALPLAAALGVFSGWYACRVVGVNHAKVRLEGEAERVREVLVGFNRLATVMVSDLRSHKRTITQLSEELRSIDLGEAKAVAEVVARLIQVNDETQQRLLEAETKLEQQARELQAMATEASTDSLTNLANRRAFNEELARRFAEHERTQRPLSVLFIDVDHFKQFNDQHGHLAGDAVLRAVASALRQTVRNMDMVSRYGGEEFAVVLPNTPTVSAVAVAERARMAIENMTIRYEGSDYQITVSAGVAELRSSEQVAMLLRRADESLYASKTAGRNVTHYHDGREIRPANSLLTSLPPAEAVSPALPAPAAVQPEFAATETVEPAAPVEEIRRPRVARPRPAPDRSALEPSNAEPFTAVCDRSAFCHAVRSRLAEWKRGGGRLTVAIARIDDWKEDGEVEARLRELVQNTVGRQLVAAVREMDVVGKYSDHTFGILLPRIALADAGQVARRLHHFVRDCTVMWNEKRIPLTISLGLAEVQEGDDIVRLIERANEAMASARQCGGQRTFLHTGQWAVALGSDQWARSD